MSSQGYTGIEINNSEDTSIKSNIISVHSENGIGIQVNNSKRTEITENQILSSKQLEIISNLKTNTQNLLNQNIDSEMKNSLNQIISQVEEINNAKQESLLSKVHTLSETISNIIDVSAEDSPVRMTLLPYIYAIYTAFSN